MNQRQVMSKKFRKRSSEFGQQVFRIFDQIFKEEIDSSSLLDLGYEERMEETNTLIK